MTEIKNYLGNELNRTSEVNTQVEFLANFLDNKDLDLKVYIEKNWHASIWPILEGILAGEKVSEDVRKKMRGWNIETRSIEAYLVKVFLAWLVEDYLFNWLESNAWIRYHYFVKKGGTDAKRELKAANQCTGDPDLYIVNKKTGEIIHLEVSMDNKAFVIANSCVDTRMRDNGTSKYQDLQDKRNEANVKEVFLLIFDVKNNTVTFLPIDETTKKLKEFRNGAWGGRWCIRLEVDSELKRFEIKLKMVA